MRLAIRYTTALSLMCGAILGASGCSSDDKSGGISIGQDVAVDATPNPVIFSSIATGSTANQFVTIRHIGTSGTLRLSNIRLVTENGSNELTLGAIGQTELLAGESTTVEVIYSPVDTITDRATLYVSTNAATTGGVTRTLEIRIETLAPDAVLAVFPNPVAFGDVEVGQVSERTVSLINTGSEPLQLESLSIVNGIEGAPFSITEMPSVPLTVRPNESSYFKVAYAPQRAGGDNASLHATYRVSERAEEMNPVAVTGLGVGARFVASPNPIDFGWRSVGQSHTTPLVIANQGTRPLELNSLRLSDDSSGTVSWTGFANNTVIAPNGVSNFDVVFTPTSDMPQTTGPIATLVFDTNDQSDGGENFVYVFGRAEVPVLQVTPGDLVDFAFTAQNLTNTRAVVLYNAGSAPLTIDSVTVDSTTGEYAIVADGWGPTANPATSVTLEAAQYREVRVSFTNRGASSGTEFGKLIINSNDGARPTWEVDLRASRAGAPTCDIQIVPSVLDYGVVARGTRRVMAANIVNAGSGECSFHSALVNDCSSSPFGPLLSSCNDPSTTPQFNGNSTRYTITRSPPAIQGGLRPGVSYPIEITFTPPSNAPIFGDEMTSYSGLLALRVIDPYSGSNTPVIFPKPNNTGGLSPYTPNLHAKSGIAQLAVLPSEVDFGLTTVGCFSQTVQVTAYNVGSAPLELSDIQLQGCSAEFRIRSSPGLPRTMGMNGSEVVEVVYRPQDTSSDSCGLAFYTNNETTPTIVVPLKGKGTYESEHTDVFVQTTGQDVDVLFVVDNSGSMEDEQGNLAANFQSFIQGAATWQNNYHVGVTSTDLEADAGRLLRSGNNARFVTSANWQQFQQNVRLGTNGSADEKGLAAAQAALTLPNTADSGTTCSADADCQVPEVCVSGICGGVNRGFLRPDAALEVVVVSDEEDSSPSDLNFYINFFRSIKGFYNTNMFHFHAIVGDAGNGCSSSAGSAGAGHRYINVAQATGGAVVSICDSNFSSGLSSIGDIAFGLRTQFFLGRVPVPSTITVSVGGTSCSTAGGQNWFYQESGNSLVFNEHGGCMPQAGQEVRIHYETVCYLQ